MLNVNGVEVSRVFANGVEMQNVFANNTQVFGGSSPFDPEANLGTPTITNGPGQFDWTGPLSGNIQVVIAMDLTFPSTPPASGMIFEQGGGGRGALIIYREGYLRFRCGDGGGSVAVGIQGYNSSGGGKYMWDIPEAEVPFDGNQHTIVWEIDPRSSSPGMRIWIDGELIASPNNLGAFESNQWTGGASGGFLQHNTNVAGETNFDQNWPIQSGDCRAYHNTLVT